MAAIVAYLVKIKGKDQQAIPPAVGLPLPLDSACSSMTIGLDY